MSIDDLSAALLADAKAEAEAIREEARVEAARLSSDADAHHRAHFDAELVGFRAACQAETHRQVAAALRRLRIEVLRDRAELLERIRAAVAARLPGLLANPALADALVTAVLSVTGPQATAIRCAPALMERVRARAPSLDVVEDPSVGAGLAAAVDGGRITVTATLESELEQQWQALQIEALDQEHR
jgi:vacuolar-type H+-ATPase subunit E/Vma4